MTQMLEFGDKTRDIYYINHPGLKGKICPLIMSEQMGNLRREIEVIGGGTRTLEQKSIIYLKWKSFLCFCFVDVVVV